MIPLFRTRDERIWMFNCTHRGDVLDVGAVYLSPYTPSGCYDVISKMGDLLTIVIPEDCYQPVPLKAYNVSFPINY